MRTFSSKLQLSAFQSTLHWIKVVLKCYHCFAKYSKSLESNYINNEQVERYLKKKQWIDSLNLL